MDRHRGCKIRPASVIVRKIIQTTSHRNTIQTSFYSICGFTTVVGLRISLKCPIKDLEEKQPSLLADCICEVGTKLSAYPPAFWAYKIEERKEIAIGENKFNMLQCYHGLWRSFMQGPTSVSHGHQIVLCEGMSNVMTRLK